MRGVGIAIVLAVGGCSGRGASSTTASSVPAQEPPLDAPPPEPYVLPALVPGPAFETQCVDFPKPNKGAPAEKRKTYDFDARPMPLGTDGPRFADRSRAGYARTPFNLYGVIRRREPELEACWKWASAAMATPLDTKFRVGFDVDPWGAIGGVASEGIEDAGLRGCVEQAITGSRATGVSTRHTRGYVDVQLVVADQPAWKKKPKQPKAAPALASPYHGRRCAPVLTEAPVDELVIVDPVIISDWDAAREPKPKRRTQALSVSVCQPPPTPDLDKRGITGAVLGNAAVFGACHAEARARDPELAGELVVDFTIDRVGGLAVTKLDGAGDATLHACVKAAFEELWFHPASTVEIDATWTWSLTPPAPLPGGDDPDARLEAGDAAGALALWQAQLTAQRHGLASCRARHGVIRAMLVVAPWKDDARVTAAIVELVAEAASLGADDRRTCLAEASELLTRLIPGDPHFVTGGRERVDAITTLWLVVDAIAWERDLIDVKLSYARGLAMFDLPAGVAIADAVAAETSDVDDWAQHVADELRSGDVFDEDVCAGDLY